MYELFPKRNYVKSAIEIYGKGGYGIYVQLTLVDYSVVKFNLRAKQRWIALLDNIYL